MFEGLEKQIKEAKQEKFKRDVRNVIVEAAVNGNDHVAFTSSNGLSDDDINSLWNEGVKISRDFRGEKIKYKFAW
jgi:hypothetical protein